jgi:MYXO-CTERM domain-containing protein
MRHHLLASALAVLVVSATPSLSQAQEDMDTARADDRDGGTNGEWGLLGLLGLAGLAGLKRRDRHEDVTRSSPASTR